MTEGKPDPVKNQSDNAEIESGDICDVEDSTVCANYSTSPVHSPNADTTGQSAHGRNGGETLSWTQAPERMATPPAPHENTEEGMPVLVPVSESCESTPETPRVGPSAVKVPVQVPVPILPPIQNHPVLTPTTTEFVSKEFQSNSLPNLESSIPSGSPLQDSMFQTNPISPYWVSLGINSGGSTTEGTRLMTTVRGSPTSVPMAHISGCGGDPVSSSLPETKAQVPALPTLNSDTGSSGFLARKSTSQHSENQFSRFEESELGISALPQWSEASSVKMTATGISVSATTQVLAKVNKQYSNPEQFLQGRNQYQQPRSQPSRKMKHSHSRSPSRTGINVGGSAKEHHTRGATGNEFLRGRPRQSGHSYPARAAASSPSSRAGAGASSPLLRSHNPTFSGPTQPSQHSSHQQHFQTQAGMSSSQPVRTAPEILKTLLRKKACLYEAGTSRAIAMITWLVGRELAIRTGYFSRQELQCGVHHVVAEVIETGAITRTKVNRCMQIILNSCFHYIIPRPDGVESGDRFRRIFAEEATNDSNLLSSLLPPWNEINLENTYGDIHVPEDESHGEESGSSGGGNVRTSPRVRDAPIADQHEMQEHESEEGGQPIGVSVGNKRVVLLCFNENVRSFRDVFRCHNEFIRDVAHAGNLELTAEDWKDFFSGKGVSLGLQKRTSSTPTSSPSWRHAVSPEKLVPDLVLDEEGYGNSEKGEMYGAMSSAELSAFRTSWCCKRYDHDPFLCGFAHVSINEGWLRRDPLLHKYCDELCPDIIALSRNVKCSFDGCFANLCSRGVSCEYSHSREEVDYHPNRYKRVACTSLKGTDNIEVMSHHKGNRGVCARKFVCPFLHPTASSQRQHRRSGSAGAREHAKHERSGPTAVSRFSDQHHKARQSKHRFSEAPSLGVGAGAGAGAEPYDAPCGAPMMYLSPAPLSEFEKSLMFPGLRALFRRQCSVLYTNLRHDPERNGFCRYDTF